MRVVLDTNIYVSALLTPGGTASALLRLWRDGHFELVTSSTVLAELRRVLNYPKFERLRERNDKTILDLMTLLGTHSIYIQDVEEIPLLPTDPDDTPILALAVAAGADVIVSGDAHLLDLGAYGGFGISTYDSGLTFVLIGPAVTERVRGER